MLEILANLLCLSFDLTSLRFPAATVREAQDVAHKIILVAEVLDLPATLAWGQCGDEGCEPSREGIVGVICGDVVSVLDTGPLAELVVEEAVYVVVPVSGLFSPGCLEKTHHQSNTFNSPPSFILVTINPINQLPLPTLGPESASIIASCIPS